jgi:hypothetical protein
MAAIWKPDADELSPRERAAVRFAQAITIDAGAIPADVYTYFIREFTPLERIEVAIIATYSRPNLRPHCRIVSCSPRCRGRPASPDHAQAQREPKIQPYRVADDLSGVAMAGINRARGVLIPPVYLTNPAPTKPALGQLDGARWFHARVGAPSTWHLQINGRRDGLSDARRYA